jgi:hypothetical protein
VVFFLEDGTIGVVRSILLTLVVVRRFQLTGEADWTVIYRSLAVTKGDNICNPTAGSINLGRHNSCAFC